jgi:thioredoxin 1
MRFDSSNFEQEVLQSELPVLVDFYADWCGPCKMMAPVIDELEKEYAGKIKVGKVDVDADEDLAGEYGVMSIPMFGIFKGGKLVDSAIGAIPKASLEEKIVKAIG